MAATEGGLTTTLSSSSAPGRTELVGPGATLADERLLPVLPALQPLLPHPGLRRGAAGAFTRSAARALALVAGASAAGSWVAAVGLPDLGIVAAAETGVVLERLGLVPAPGPPAWPTGVAAPPPAPRPPGRAPGGGRPPGRRRRGAGPFPARPPLRPGPPPDRPGPRARRGP